MALNDDQRRMLQTNLARDKAEALLEGLKRARAEAEDRIVGADNLDPQRIEQGRHAMQRAIEAAQRMVDSLNSAMDVLDDDLTDENLSDALGDSEDTDETSTPEQPKE